MAVEIQIDNPFSRDIMPHPLLYGLGRSLPDGTVLVFETPGQSENAVYLATLGYPVFKADPDIGSTISFTTSARTRSLTVRGIAQGVGEFNLNRTGISQIHPNKATTVNNVVILDEKLGLIESNLAEAQLGLLQNITAKQGMHILQIPANPYGIGLVVSQNGHGENNRLKQIYETGGFDVIRYDEVPDRYEPQIVSHIDAIFRKR